MTTSNEIKDLWQLDKYCSSKVICQAGEQLYLWLKNNKHDVLAQYICGAVAPPEEIPPFFQLEHEIAQHFSPLSQAIHYLMALALVINQGNNTGVMNICPPRIPLYVRPDKSPFQDEYLDCYYQVTKWRECILNPTSPQEPNQQEFIGRLLSSAALNGGLLHSHGLAALYLKLSDHLEAITHNDKDKHDPEETLVFYDLKISSDNTQLTRLQRWFPDRFTEFLILSFTGSISNTSKRSTANKKLQKQIFTCIKKFFMANGLEARFMPRSLASFLRSAQAEMWLYLPGYLGHFAAGKLMPHSPKDYVWKRMFNLLKNPRSSIKYPANNETEHDTNKEMAKQLIQVPKDELANTPMNIFTLPWLKEISSVLKNTNRRTVKYELRILRKNSPASQYSLNQLITGWAEFMVSKKSYAGNTLFLSTIKNYIGQISNRIAGYANGEDITLLEGEGLEEIYRQILSDITSESYQQNIARGLREFHFYLVEQFHLAPINYKEILGLVSPDRIVDANIISFDEYHAILEEFDHRHSDMALIHDDLPDIVRLIFILSFRCGLRRSEVLKLMIDDLHDMHPATLLIRPNYARTLKTKSSIRQIPLSLLLSHDELADLINFLNKRLKQENQSPYSSFLFAMPDNLNLIAPAVKVFSLITEIMKKVTRDPAPKFHHLRHSFASWATLRLMLASLKPAHNIRLPNMPITSKYLNNATHFKEKLLGAYFPSKKYVRAIASLLGHSGPESSIPHYIHFSDILLKITLEDKIPCLDHVALKTLLPVHRSTCHRWYTQDGINGVTRNFRKKMTNKRISFNRDILANTDTDEDVDIPTPTEVKYIYKIWQYLILSSKKDAKTEDLQIRLDISETQNKIIADCISTMKEKQAPNQQGSPYLWLYKIFDRRKMAEKTETKGLRHPRTKENKKIVVKYAPQVWSLFNTNPDLTALALKCFLNNVWGSEPGIIFRGYKEDGLAKKYISFLKALGLAKDQIKIYSYDYHGQRSAIKGKWFKKLNLNKRDKIHKKKPPFDSRNEAVRQWLQVDVKLCKGDKTGSSAFRFLMTMTLICLDFPGRLD